MDGEPEPMKPEEQTTPQCGEEWCVAVGNCDGHCGPTKTDEELNALLEFDDCWDECDEGHEWISLDRGETIECRHCDADITADQLEALYEADY